MLRHSDSVEDVTKDLFGEGAGSPSEADLAGMDDLDLDKELGLDKSDSSKQQEQQPRYPFLLLQSLPLFVH